MTKIEKAATIMMTILVAISFTYGCMKAVAPRDTDPILTECGINPVNGSWMEGAKK